MNLKPSQSVANLRGDLGGSNEQSYIVPSELDGVNEIQSITCPSMAEAAQGDYFVLTKQSGDVVAVWLDIDAAGIAPTGAAYLASDVQIEVDIVTGDTAAQVAAKIVAAIVADTGLDDGFSYEADDDVIMFTALLSGDCVDPAVHNTGDTGDGSFVAAVELAGAAPSVAGLFFTFSNTSTNFYAWFSSNGVGTDPAESGTGIEIALTGSETNAQYLAAIVSAIDGASGMSAELDGSTIIVSVDAIGEVADVGAGDSGFSVSIGSQGNASSYLPSSNLAAQSPEPGLIG